MDRKKVGIWLRELWDFTSEIDEDVRSLEAWVKHYEGPPTADEFKEELLGVERKARRLLAVSRRMRLDYEVFNGSGTGGAGGSSPQLARGATERRGVSPVAGGS